MCSVGQDKDKVNRFYEKAVMESKEDKVPSLSPKKSAQLIVEGAKDVKVNQPGLDKAADMVFEAVKTGKLSLKNFKQTELHPNILKGITPEKAIDWIFLVDTLNFSFWSGGGTTTTEPKWEVEYNGKIYTGYFALCAGVNRAIHNDGLDLTNPKIFGSLTLDDILHIFRSATSTPIPLPQDRLKNLHDAGQVLLSKYNGSFANCVRKCQRSAERLLNLIVTDFPSFDDRSLYNGIQVSILKRAQILIADIWACFEGEGLGTFDDIDTLSMFADYRIPQVLLHFGALEYSRELYEFLEKGEELENGDRREIEIRGASIQAVELINEKVKSRLQEAGLPLNSINSIMIDHFLWDYRREHSDSLEKYPFHKTRCIFY